MFEYFYFRRFGFWTPAIQISALVLLCLVTAWVAHFSMTHSGRAIVPVTAVSLMFAPVKEEIIFRGFILRWFELEYSRTIAIWSSCVLFGLWHIQNIFMMEPKFVAWQVLYTMLIGGQITARMALYFKSIWPGAIFHSVTNLIALTSLQDLFLSFLK